MNQDDRLGPYRLIRRLGEGGMGVVHLAVDPQGRQVAVKVLRSEVAGDDVARRRLSREVETMRRVRSRYIAEVLDADVTGSRPYIVTRYVPGRPLDEVVKQDGPLGADALVRVAYGVAEALVAVHAAGVIHRDLKPGNVLMMDGDPVLIDFGIAQAVDATRLTQTGMFIGTPGYLAPEIIEGGEAGPEIDVHAWAGTLLFAATGQPPFGKGTLEMIFFNITAGRANVDGAPQVLRPILRSALSRVPASRPTASELARRTAQMLPSAPKARPRVPDEITTMPNLDTPQVGAAAGSPPPPPPLPLPLPTPTHVPRPASADEFVSLLGETPAVPSPGDPWPTVRVTGQELRSAGLLPRDVPATGDQHGGPSLPAHQEADIPTRRVRTSELSDLVKRPTGPPPVQRTPMRPQPVQSQPVQSQPVQPQPVRPQPVSGSQAFREMTPDNIYEQTPHRRRSDPPPTAQTVNVPPAHAGSVPERSLPRSRVYGVVSTLMLLTVAAIAVRAPVVAIVIAMPVVILLRAADIAQPQLGASRGAAAGDVLRVLGRPAALVKSASITVALVPYALILGLPVTLLLTVLVGSMSTANALSWGTAVALWTICAGPGVEGPGRQMRRTLASMFSTRSAMMMAWALGVVATAAVLLALATLAVRSQQTTWQPFDILNVIDRLDELRRKAQSS